MPASRWTNPGQREHFSSAEMLFRRDHLRRTPPRDKVFRPFRGQICQARLGRARPSLARPPGRPLSELRRPPLLSTSNSGDEISYLHGRVNIGPRFKPLATGDSAVKSDCVAYDPRSLWTGFLYTYPSTSSSSYSYSTDSSASTANILSLSPYTCTAGVSFD